MNWIASRIKGIMLVSGVLTCTMLFAALAPQAALQSMFGDTLQGPLAEIIVRNWGALIALVGVVLIYAAFDPPSRRVVALLAVVSKTVFIALVLSYGQPYLGGQLLIAVVGDAIMVLLFAAFLLTARHTRTAA